MTEFIDLAEYRQQAKDSFLDLWDESLTLAENVSTFLTLGVKLPNPSVTEKIVVCYLLAHSALLNVAPVLFLWGKEGTGKSKIGILASKIHNVPIFSSSSTFAAIRNYLSTHRFKEIILDTVNHIGVYDRKTIEQHIILIWDDLDPKVFTEKPDLYRLLKYGYNRETSMVQISSTEKLGNNLKFDSFGLKIVGSVSNFSDFPKFRELSRRLLTIPTCSIKQLSYADKLSHGMADSFNPLSLLDYNQLDWDGLNQKFKDFWSKDLNLKRYLNALKSLSSTLARKLDLLSPNQFTLVRELIATGIVLDLWDKPIDALEAFKALFDANEQRYGASNEQLLALLKAFTDREIALVEQFNRANQMNLPVEIKNAELLNQLDVWQANGDVPQSLPSHVIKQAMLSLGFYPKSSLWVRKHD